MGRQRAFPFPGMLLVCPAGAVGCPISLGALGKCLGVGGLERRSSTVGLAGSDRVLALEQQRPAGAGLLARFGERDGGQGTQSVIALAAGTVAEHPPAALFVHNP